MKLSRLTEARAMNKIRDSDDETPSSQFAHVA